MEKSQNIAGYLLSRYVKIDTVKSALDVKSVVMIQAGPGQGKTEFAKALGHSCYDRSLYYKVTEADRDAVYFCRSIHSLFSGAYPKYSCPEFEQVLSENRPEPREAENYVKMIIKSLRKNLMKRTVIILDDLNILPDIGLACMTVLTAVASSGGLLSFILCTQNQCRFPEKFSRLNKTVYRIEGDFLALTEQEFRELAVNMVDDSCPMDGMEKIFLLTEGWIGGAVRILENISPCRKEDMNTDYFVSLFDDYFLSITEKYNKKHFAGICLLSFLDSADFDFMSRQDAKYTEIIQDMLIRNLFISFREGRIYFNHLFREWMMSRALKLFSEQEISDIFITAYSYEMHKGNKAKALGYLIKSKNYTMVEEFTEKHYYAVTSKEYSRSLHNHILRIPKEVLDSFPWIKLLAATILALSGSTSVTEMFDSSYMAFREKNDTHGMLASCSGLVCMYTASVGDLEKAGLYFKELKRLKDLMPETDAASSIYIHLASAMGCLYLGSSLKAVEHLDRARVLSVGYSNSGVRSRIYSAYVIAYLMLCDREMTDKYCDTLIVKLNTSGYGYSQKRYIIEHLLYYAAMHGMSGMMNSLTEMIRRNESGLGREDNTIDGFIDMSLTDISLASGNTENALRIMNAYSESRIDVLPPHRASFLYSLKAIVSACSCDETAAVYAEKSVRLRQTVSCNRYFVSMTNYLAGAAYALLGSHKKAEHYLMMSVSDTEEGGNINASGAAYAYLSYLYNNIGDRLMAREYAVYSIKLFRRTNFSRYIGLLPEVVLNACSYAFTDASVSHYASQIAFDRYDTAFSELGRRIPVMKVTTLNGLSLSIGGKVMDCADIGTNFRLLMAALISSGGYTLEQEAVQSSIWPDSGREQARKSFDNLISRFRKMLSDYFNGIDPKDYLVINNGVLRFKNIKCDADEFLSNVKSAKDSYASGGYTKAVEKLINASKLFNNRYFVSVSNPVNVMQKKREVDAAFISMLKTMHRVSFFLPDVFRPEIFFDTWLDTFMSETEMVAAAFSYYSQKGMQQKCREVIRDFTAFLRQDGYTEEEIADLVFVVKTAI